MMVNWELISAEGVTLGFMLKTTTRNLRSFMLERGLSYVFVIERNEQDEEQGAFNATIRNGRIYTDR